MYVIPNRPPLSPEKMQVIKEKTARDYLAKGMPPEVVAKKVNLPLEEVRALI